MGRKATLLAKIPMVCLLGAGLWVSCLTPGSMQHRAEKPKDPYFLANHYLEDLKHGNASKRTEAAWKLGESYVKRTPEVVPALIGALKDPFPKVRANAAGALSRIGEEARPAQSALREALHDPYGATVLNAARALRSLKVSDQALLPDVRKILEDEKGTVRVDAARLLRAMGVPDREILPTLVSVLSDPMPEARKASLELLNEMKLRPIPKEVAHPVIGALKDRDEEVRWKAALLLGNSYIPVIEARKPLTDALNDPSSVVVEFAASALGAYGKSAQDAVPKLFEILNTSPEEGVRSKVCEALGRIGSPKSKIAEVLVKVLASDPSPSTRGRAASALRDLKHKDKSVMEALKKAAAQDPHPTVRALSSVALRQLEDR